MPVSAATIYERHPAPEPIAAVELTKLVKAEAKRAEEAGPAKAKAGRDTKEKPGKAFKANAGRPVESELV
jgi:hypothetical protein